MTIGQLIAAATQKLRNCGIVTARLDCLILLEDVTGRDRAALLAHDDQVITAADYETFDKLLTRRCTHEPLAYIRGAVQFYGRRFTVSPQVLVPRPETESCVELVNELSLPPQTAIADIGTGSGCIGVTLALEHPAYHIDLYDIDTEALAVAHNNAVALGAKVRAYQSDLLASLRRHYDLIVTNLPYVPDHYPINEAAGFEPPLALFAGVDGLAAYRDFWRQIAQLEHRPDHIICESFPNQHHANALLARNQGYVFERANGFAQHFVRDNTTTPVASLPVQ